MKSKIKLVKENLKEALAPADYSEAGWKMDKFLPDDPDIQEEYYEILDDENLSHEVKVQALIEFFMNYADEDRMYSYFPKGGNVTDFAKHLIKDHEG